MKIKKEQLKLVKMFMIEKDISFKDDDKYSVLETRMFQDCPRIDIYKRKNRLELSIQYGLSTKTLSDVDIEAKKIKDFWTELLEYIGDTDE